MGFWDSLEGTLRLELVSAVPAEMLTAVNEQGVMLRNVTYVSELTVICTIQRSDYPALQRILQQRGENIKVLRRSGIFWGIQGLKRRPVLVLGLLLLLAVALYLPTRVLFIEVTGNHNVPETLILEKAQICGVKFLASRREVRSEVMKNALLGAIPELQWAGINTYGCTAVISVKERTAATKSEVSTGVSSIVAVKDGVIQEMTVLQGNPLCKVGDAVKKGQVIVSGYTDCGISIQATCAKGEVFALTEHCLTAIHPKATEIRGEIKESHVNYSLIIGKKLINLSKDSGISHSSCVKMYSRYCITLPGGFQLPLGLLRQQRICYDSVEATEVADNEQWVRHYTEKYLRQNMIAGKILAADYTEENTGDRYILAGEFSCLEMIGRLRSEEILKHNGENH